MENGRHFIFPTDITEDADGNTIFSFKTLDANGITALVAFTRLKEQQKGPDTAAVSRSHSWKLEEPGLEPRQADSRALTLESNTKNSSSF